MKKLVGFWALLLSACAPVLGQIDTAYIYNTAMPYGTLDLRVAKSPTRYYYLQEDVTFSYRESSPGVKTNTFRDMTSWNSDPFRQGNLREKNGNQDLFVMNYRFILPNNYNASYEPGYPIIIMFHGLGERGNCWNDNCYWNTPSWNPNTNSPPAPTSETHNLLNNDHNLLHGGQKHLAAITLAGSKLPNDPTLPPTSFPGIVVFPQNINGWGQATRVEDAIRLLRLVIKKYNVDENRVYIHGLSNGGGAVFQALKRAPWLFAASAPMSAINDGGIVNDGFAAEVSKIPLWVFQGGKDKNPSPSRTYNTIKKFREAGSDVRYYLYEHLGHGTWNTAYSEPDFFPWILSKRKYNPHVYYGNPVICNTNGVGVRLGFSNGFPAYQWERDGEIIPDAITSQYTTNIPGTYRGRISRKANPSESDWQPWSDPIIVTEINPAKPTITAIGTTHLRGPGVPSSQANNTVLLKSNPEAELYTWYKNGVPVDFSGTDVEDTLRTAPFTTTSTNANAAYTLITRYSYCPSPPSDPVYLFFNNSAPQNISLNATSVDFKGSAISSGVFLSWNDLASNESGYEIWRKKSGTAQFKLAGRTAKDAITFFDAHLEPSVTYFYKLRAISNTGTSNYIPSNDININYSITTPADEQFPSAPQQLTMIDNTLNSITLSWQPSTDNTGIKKYLIQYGSTVVSTDTSLTTFVISGLPPNTAYPVSVKAVDYSGKSSPSSNQIMASTYVSGLFYKHSTGAWETLEDTTILETWIAPEFTGKVTNFSLTPRTQEDYFNFEFTGYLHILTEGDYLFRLTSNDGSRLYIDDSLSVDNDGVHGNITKFSDTLHFTAGPHRLKLQFFDYVGSQTLTLQYKGPDLTKSYVAIPDSLFRSGKYIPPTAPAVPINLTAIGSGMQQVDLAWQNAETNDVEIYRSTSATGTFSIVGRTSQTTLSDTVELIPGATYFYKARAVSGTGLSAFTPVISAITNADVVAPSVPASLQLSNQTHTHVAFTWSPSDDNVVVSHYEVFSNGTLIGTTEIPAFMAKDLLPSTTYNFTVRAVDANNNQSGFSATLTITTNPSAVFYSLATGNLNTLSTWKQNVNGTGNSPVSFDEAGQYFMISNRTQTGLGGAWSVTGGASKVIVPTGVTLNADNAFTGKVELEGTAVLNLNHEIAPELQKISPTSTVNFGIASSVPAKNYGSVIFSGIGIKNFEADTTFVNGNISVASGITLKGAPGNSSLIFVNGNLSVVGATGMPGADNRIDFRFKGPSTHTLTTGGNLYFYSVSLDANSALNVSSTNGSVEFVAGSLNGGGIVLGNGSLLTMGANTLHVELAGVINGGNEAGAIAVGGGTLKLVSSSSQNSNLYFDASNNTLDSLELNLSGTGKAIIRSNAKLTDFLKIKNGKLDANGHLTLLSTALKTAAIGEIENSGLITGTIGVQQYLEPLGESWRDLSVPVSDVTVSQWQNYFPITGPFAGSSGGTESSMFISSSTGPAPFPPSGGSNLALLERGKGYHTKINNTNPITLQSIGNPFQNTIAFNLSGGTGGGANNGWNLLGNPYASPIQWSPNSDSWTSSGVNRTIAVLENKLINGQPVGQYIYFDPLLGNGIIRQGQGFWIQAFTASPSLTINEHAKVESITPPYPQPNVDVSHMIVTLQQGTKMDATYIFLTPEATDNFDNQYDVLKRTNEGIFNLSSLIAGASVAVNHLQSGFCNKSVKLNIQDASPGGYTLNFSGLESLAALGQVTLKDNFTGSTTAITSTPYSFSITADATSVGTERFLITFSRNQLDVATPQVSAADLCTGDHATISIQHAQAGVQYSVINDENQVMSELVEAADATATLSIPVNLLKTGNNHIRVNAGFAGCTTQLLTSQDNFDYTPSFSITVQEDVSVCYGDQAMLQASGVPVGGHYRWMDENDVVIDSVHDANLITNPVLFETIIKVAGVLANGCESEIQTIHLYADTLELPVITFYNDTLFVQVQANYQWTRNGSFISGADKPFFHPETSGTYRVIVSRMGCSKESEAYQYFVDPGCAVDTTTPTASAHDSCGEDIIDVTITSSQPGVGYAIVDTNENIVSATKIGNGGTLILELSAADLDSGSNHMKIRADFPGCLDRFLKSEVTFAYQPPLQIPAVIFENGILATSSTGTYQWKLEGEIINSATNSDFAPLVSGEYSVVVTNGMCTVESAPYQFYVTATEGGSASEFVLNTYPVPAKGSKLVVSVQSPTPDRVYVEVIDITGRSVFSKSYAYSDLSWGVPVVPLSGPFMDGVYCVVARQGRNEIRRRIVIKN